MSSTNETGHAKNVANFHDLIDFCIGYGGNYNPTRADLLTQRNSFANSDHYRLKNDLIAANNDVSSKYTEVSNSRINRDRILYRDPTGLVFIAQEVKKYVKSVFGATSQQFGQVKGIKFTIKKI